MRTALTSFLAVTYVVATFLGQSVADSLNPKELKNSVGMKLVYIPPGKFTMGSPETEPGRESQETPHEVELTKGFYIGAYEVTVGQFKQFVAATNFRTDGERDGKGAYGIDADGKINDMKPEFTWKNPGFEQTDQHPVVNVSWTDAKVPRLVSVEIRLPTEAATRAFVWSWSKRTRESRRVSKQVKEFSCFN